MSVMIEFMCVISSNRKDVGAIASFREEKKNEIWHSSMTKTLIPTEYSKTNG